MYSRILGMDAISRPCRKMWKLVCLWGYNNEEFYFLGGLNIMALIKCPKCGKEISDKAKECVGCGWEVNLDILYKKADEVVSNETDLKKDTSYERKIMLREAELEIKKMKENARQEIKLMNGNVKKFVSLVKNGSFLVRIKIWKFLSKRSIYMPVAKERIR